MSKSRDSKKVKLYAPPAEGPKILIFDLETLPLTVSGWGLFDQNFSLEQIEQDWSILSFSALWNGAPETEVMYQDTSAKKNVRDDKDLLQSLWTLIDQADIVVAHNAKSFDVKRLNARFILNGFQPPSHYRVIDTLAIAKRKFGMTSNKLQYLTEKLCTKYKKSGHKKYPGYLLWAACLNGDKEAFAEMEEYNKLDVLSLNELYDILRAWDNNHPNLNVYYGDLQIRCRCGSINLHKRGFAYSNLGKYQLHRCKDCGAEVREKTNLLDKEKRNTLKGNLT